MEDDIETILGLIPTSWIILSVSSPRIRAWTRIAPGRVFASLNGNSTEIEYYTVDGKRVPPFGLGSLIVFNGLDEGILNRAGRTIKAAASLAVL